jgi:hypothetical protein
MGIFHIFYQECFWSLYPCHGHHGFGFIELHLNIFLIFFATIISTKLFTKNDLISMSSLVFYEMPSLLSFCFLLPFCPYVNIVWPIFLHMLHLIRFFNSIYSLFLGLHLHLCILFKFKPLDENNTLSPLNTRYLFCILTMFSCFNNCIINAFSVYWLSSKLSYAHVTKL